MFFVNAWKIDEFNKRLLCSSCVAIRSALHSWCIISGWFWTKMPTLIRLHGRFSVHVGKNTSTTKPSVLLGEYWCRNVCCNVIYFVSCCYCLRWTCKKNPEEARLLFFYLWHIIFLVSYHSGLKCTKQKGCSCYCLYTISTLMSVFVYKLSVKYVAQDNNVDH